VSINRGGVGSINSVVYCSILGVYWVYIGSINSVVYCSILGVYWVYIGSILGLLIESYIVLY